MSKNVTLKQNGEVVYPRTKWENIIDAPTLESINQMQTDIEWLMEHGGGGGGGGGGETPVTTKAVYYGGYATEIVIDGSTNSIIKTLHKVNRKTISDVPCDMKYYYISTPSEYALKKVMSENNENLTDLFILKGTYLLDDETYKLYEFHLSSDIPLDANITITIT